MTVIPKIAEMREKVAAIQAQREHEATVEKCRIMSEVIAKMRAAASLSIIKAADRGEYMTGLSFKDHFSDVEQATVLFCLKKVAEELIAEGYKVRVNTNCHISIMWKLEEKQ